MANMRPALKRKIVACHGHPERVPDVCEVKLMAEGAEYSVRWITAALEPRRPQHCWSVSVCRLDSPPNLLIETLGC
jgi:hypothetical protein